MQHVIGKDQLFSALDCSSAVVHKKHSENVSKIMANGDIDFVFVSQFQALKYDPFM